jgi:hypothetical protein
MNQFFFIHKYKKCKNNKFKRLYKKIYNIKIFYFHLISIKKNNFTDLNLIFIILLEENTTLVEALFP